MGVDRLVCCFPLRSRGAVVGGLWTASGFIAFALVVLVWLAAPPRSLWRDRSRLLPLPVTAVASVLARVVAVTDRCSANPLAVFVTTSDHGAVASLLCPLAVWGERLASQA